MAVELGVVLAALMGAAAALMGGVLSQRYQYLLERQKEHFVVLRDNVLTPWKRAVAARKANLEGRDPYVVVDYVAKDYRSTPGMAFAAGGDVPWSEASRLAQESRRHWPQLWREWEALNEEFAALGARTVEHLRRLEAAFPPLPAGRQWANYPEDPATALKIAVVSVWATHAQAFERRTYPDWVVSQLAEHGFWRGDDVDARLAYAKQVAAALEATDPAGAARLERDGEELARRYQEFAGRVEDAIQTERFTGRCGHCPRFLS